MGNTPNQTAPVAKQPPLWRQILSAGLLGIGAGLAAEKPEQAFGAGFEAVETQKDRELKRAAFVAGQQRETERLGLEKQRVGYEGARVEIEKGRALSEEEANHARAMEAMTNKLLIEKQLEFLPAEQQRKIAETFSQIDRNYAEAGLYKVAMIGDSIEARQKFLEQHSLSADLTPDSKPLTGYIFAPSPETGRVNVYLRDDTKKLKPEQAAQLSKVVGINIPPDLPIPLVDVLISRKMMADAQRDVARIEVAGRQAAKTQAEKPLDFKSALAQSRAEIAPLIEADSYLPQTRRQYPDQAAVTKAVNKRAQELLDLDAQLRRSGVTQTGNILSALSALKEQRRRGGSDATLKQLIATAAMQGQLTAQEIITLYDQLGLVVSAPAAPQPSPQTAIGEGGQPITQYKGLPIPTAQPQPAPVAPAPASAELVAAH